jgi:hypothetical protein
VSGEGGGAVGQEEEDKDGDCGWGRDGTGGGEGAFYKRLRVREVQGGRGKVVMEEWMRVI